MSAKGTSSRQDSTADSATRGASRQDSTADSARTAAAKRRRLAEVFGDVLPETTSDEREHDRRSGEGDRTRDDWLKSQVPPHHG